MSDPLLTRRAALQVREADDEDRALGFRDGDLAIAFSSEAPVERVDWRTGESYMEVLSHDRAKVDLARAATGLPLMLEHGDVQVGRVMGVRIDADGVGRGIARPGSHPDAVWVFADMRNGIRPDISVGYRTGEYESRKEGGKVVREYAWAPHEISSVAIPADITVGVGRSVVEVATDTVAREDAAPAQPEVRAAELPHKGQGEQMSNDAAAPNGAESHRADPVWVMDKAEKLGLPSKLARDLIASELGREAVAEKLFEAAESRQRDAMQNPVQPDEKMTAREVQSFSVVRAIRSLMEGKRDGFEFEVSDAIAKKQGREVNEKSFFVPTQVRAAGMQTRANELVVSTAADGGALKFTDYAGFIDLLREKILSLSLGVQYLPGLRADFQWVRKTGGSTGGWQSTELTNQANSKWTLSTVTLQPKIYQDALIMSRKLMAQGEESVEQLVRNEIAQTHAVAIERAILNGSGASGQPTGIAAAAGIGDVAGGTNGAQPSAANIWELYTDVAAANADTGSLAFYTHPFGIARLAQTVPFSGATAGVILQPAAAGTGARVGDFSMIGFRTVASTAAPSAQTKGSSTDCYYIYFGDWSKAVLGEWGNMELVVDPYTLAPSQVKISSIQMVDVGVLYPGAFSVMKDARP